MIFIEKQFRTPYKKVNTVTVATPLFFSRPMKTQYSNKNRYEFHNNQATKVVVVKFKNVDF
jgi:hypothetical protein